MTEWPTPTNVKQLRGFLGLTGYYRKFEKGYATIAHPLTELFKKNQFAWHNAADEAFKELKKQMTLTPVLALPNFQQPFVVETDASNTGIGVVLSQNGHPLPYFSKKLTKRLSLSSAYVKELYAITQAVMKWRHYLLGRKFTIKTDHKNLKELMHQVVQTPEQQFYLSKLLGFDFEILYRTGRTNLVLDALSRQDEFHSTRNKQSSIHSFTEFMKANGTSLYYSTSYHPESDGQTEEVNRCIEQSLRPFTFDHPKKWQNFLPWAELWYNSTFHTSLGMTPYKALYGTNPSPLAGNILENSQVESLAESLKAGELLRESLKINLLKAQNRMKKTADIKRN
ncbi:Transposon Ty3-G Gag-Pol polyprotein [Senna tora]|uniref:Transposon Ty3-G Gag-Pol polyprotein n=1 Tax=Senna tora TaxID=362788 RepID=A0A834W6S4_9FABA|nr:Transposon Ty3-G Gag-Pol polyprotein [Senna tora]